MKIDDITRQSLLYDFYGALLTERQRGVLELYHEENLSLAEIAAEMGISRQGVHDALKKAERALKEYEAKLGLVEKFQRTSSSINEIDARIEGLIASMQDGRGSAAAENSSAAAGNNAAAKRQPATGKASSEVADELAQIKTIIDGIEQ